MDSRNNRPTRTFNEIFGDDFANAEELSIDYLMDLHDERFVAGAYKLLLGRKADPSGMRYYVGRLRRGYSRISMLHQLVRSPEVRADWRKIPGLPEQLDRYRRSRTVSGWRLALTDPELGLTPAWRQARIFQNGLGSQAHLLTQTTQYIHTEVAGFVSQARLEDYGDARRGNLLSTHRFQPPRARTVFQIREADLPDRIRAAVRLLNF